MAYRKVPDVDEDRSRGYELEKVSSMHILMDLVRCKLDERDFEMLYVPSG